MLITTAATLRLMVAAAARRFIQGRLTGRILSHLDSNGDGINGDAAQTVSVSPGGSDGNPGAQASPRWTVNAGIAAAASGKDVFVAASSSDEGEGAVLASGAGGERSG